MKRPEPRTLHVLQTQRVTPHMHRVTLGGEGLVGFPAGQAGGYVKLRLANGEGRTVVRTYTIRHQRDAAIDIDFALHGEETGGVATQWALRAQAGGTISVAGPGPAKPLPPSTGPFLVAGDMTALPAISVNLEALDPASRGQVFVEILNEADRQDLMKPSGVEVHWLVQPETDATPTMLADALRATPWPGDSTYAWVACEFEAMRAARAYLREERRLGADRLYASSYWKRGLVEDDHRRVKQADSSAAG